MKEKEKISSQNVDVIIYRNKLTIQIEKKKLQNCNIQREIIF